MGVGRILYDALGRRVAKVVGGRATRFLHSGAQVIQEEDLFSSLPRGYSTSDGTADQAGVSPMSGGILPGTVTARIDFQATNVATADGFWADKGRAYGVRSNGLTYGWSAALASSDMITRASAERQELDTYSRLLRPGTTAKTWNVAVPNGTYPVVVIAGDATSRNHTNNLVIEGTAVTDPDPKTTVAGYEKGDFDGYAVSVTVTDGTLTIAAGVGAYDPTLCAIEIGAAGTTIDPSVTARLADYITHANAMTFAPRAPVIAKRSFTYGEYIDDVVTFANAGRRYWAHSNHLFSVAALTDAAGNVTERYRYDAYGKQTITSAVGAVRTKSAVVFNRGFTGYYEDAETGLLFAQARMYSPTLGRFIERDPNMTLPWTEMNKQYKYRLGGQRQLVGWMPVSMDGYQDGMSLYAAYFVPNATDPTGMSPCMGEDGNSLAGLDCCLNKCLMWWSTTTVGAWCSIPGLISTIPGSAAKAPYLTTGLFKKVMGRAAICCVGWLAGILIGCEARCIGTNAAYDGLVP